MINSRDINQLSPRVHDLAVRFLNEAEKSHIEVIIISTYRDVEYQDYLYAQGRTRPGKIITYAKGGQSFHQYRCAFDVLPMQGKTPIWNASDPAYEQLGAIGKAIGLEWAGDWKKMREKAHFQYTGGLTLSDFQKGKTIQV